MKKLILLSCVCAMLSAQVEAQGKLLKRVRQQADVIEAAYDEAWDTFYGIGHYKNLMTASLDTRPDGTPNIVVDKAAGRMEVTIRLSVNEANYNAWKETTHKRFKDANMSTSFSRYENPVRVMIGGKHYDFGANERAALAKWEDFRSKAELTVYVQMVDAKGKTVREDYVPIARFGCLPVENLNRRRELGWENECSYAKLQCSGLSGVDMDSLEDVKCEILDSVDIRKRAKKDAEREAAERKAREEADEVACKAREEKEEKAREESKAVGESLQKECVKKIGCDFNDAIYLFKQLHGEDIVSIVLVDYLNAVKNRTGTFDRDMLNVMWGEALERQLKSATDKAGQAKWRNECRTFNEYLELQNK